MSSREARLKGSLIVLVGERGTTEFEFDDLLLASGLSAGDFFACFHNLGDCLDKTVSEITASICFGLTDEFEEVEGWREGMRTTLEKMLSRLVADEDLARFLVVLSGSRADCAVAHHEELTATFTDLIEAGVGDPEVTETYPRLFNETVAACIGGFLLVALRNQGAGATAEMLPELMYLIVGPYAGADIADQEMARAPKPLWR